MLGMCRQWKVSRFHTFQLRLTTAFRGQLPFLGCHLFPQNFEILLHPGIRRVLVKSFRKPAVSSGQIAVDAMAGGVHGSHERKRTSIGVTGGYF